eukprot:2484001-Rhodomonas_salina.2
MQATLGHPTTMWKGASVAQRIADVNEHRGKSMSIEDPDETAVRTNMVTVDHEQFLRLFKAVEDITDQGSVGKQLT